MRYCHDCNEDLAHDGHQFCGVCGATRPESGWLDDALVGTVVAGGQYKVRRRLGTGGFGIVYEVETVLGGLVRAMKVLGVRWARDEDVRRRFVNEAVVLDRLDHPHIARCYAVGTLARTGQPFILMELIPGRDLTLVGAPLEPKRVVRLGQQLAEAMQSAHALRLLHRDLKPENILMLDAGTEEESIKVIDFGIAKILGADTNPTATLGTPLYMAPEQFDSPGDLDARLDLWQLGAVLHYALTGHPPYRPPAGQWGPLTIFFQARARMGQPGPAPSELVPSLAGWPELDALVSSLLSTNRDDRPDSAGEVAARLAAMATPSPTTSSDVHPSFLDSLCETPSTTGWKTLCHCLRTWPDGPTRQAAIDRVARRLERWPAPIRVAPPGWWHAKGSGLWSLARAVDLSHAGLDDDDVDGVLLGLDCAPTCLSLAHNRLTDRSARALAAARVLDGLQVLDLRDNRLGPEGLEALAASPHLSQLTTLHLCGNPVGLRGIQALAASPFLTRLETLSLDGCRLDADAVAALAGAPGLSRLVALSLRHNRLGPPAAAALATADWRHLERLHMDNVQLGAEGVAALASAPLLARLRTLSLGSNRLRAADIGFLTSSPHMRQLESLTLDGNPLGAAGGVTLGVSGHLFHLGHLDVSDCGLGDAGVGALAVAPWLARTRTLVLAGNQTGADGIDALTASPFLSRVESLDLSRNPLGESGARALTDDTRLPALTELALDSCELTADAAAAIVGSADLPRVTSLDLSGNDLGPAGAHAICQSAGAGRLERLLLAENGLGPMGARVLAATERLSHVHTLGLGRNELGHAGVSQLCAASSLRHVRELYLPVNEIQAEGAGALAASPHLTQLEVLDLSHNPLGAQGAAAIAGAHQLSRVTRLTLQDCGVEAQSASMLRASPHLMDALVVDLRFNPCARRIGPSIHELRDQTIDQIQTSFQALSAQGDALVARFYEEFFARHPEIRPLFARVDMKRQGQHLLASLVLVMRKLRETPDLEPTLIAMGKRHIGYGVRPEHYMALTSTLLDVLAEFAGDAWTPQLQDSWRQGLFAVSALMLQAH